MKAGKVRENRKHWLYNVTENNGYVISLDSSSLLVFMPAQFLIRLFHKRISSKKRIVISVKKTTLSMMPSKSFSNKKNLRWGSSNLAPALQDKYYKLV
jgi:hypothetical protein